MPTRIFVLFILLALFPRRAIARYMPPPLPPQELHTRQVSNTSKAGLAWPNGPWVDINQYLGTGKVSWYYTWSPSTFDTHLEAVPMLWGHRQVDEWRSTINATIQSRHVSHVLAFNEPELPGQSNMSPQDGAALWKSEIEPLKAQGVRLGSPAPSSSPKGKQWLHDWLGNCAGGCSVDFIAMHWYDINSSAFIDYLRDFHETFQKPIWVTEWACQNFNNADKQCSQQDVIDFMNATQQFMDTTDWVERYAWFGAMKQMQGVSQFDALMNPSGAITDLGRQYIGAAPANVSTNYTPGVVHGGNGGAPPSSLQGAAPQLRGGRSPWIVCGLLVLCSVFAL